jgi:hypothetical protein
VSDNTAGTPASQGAHAADVHGEPEDHPADDGHAAHGDTHGAVALGPADWRAWLAGVVGVGAGLAVVVAMLLRPGA